MAKKGEAVKMISAHAKKIRKKDESWTNALRRATTELKKAGKI